MTPERWQEVKQALSDVLALAPAERESYLRRLRTQNADVAGEVESLLPHDTEATFLEQPAIAIGALGAGAAFGPYTIESALGEGGMGTVYLARDSSLERPVALKFLSRALQGEDDARRRFLREARAAAALDHPYICKIYQTGEQDGRPFIAMEYVRGETLRQRLDAGALSLKDALWIAMEVAEALETAHTAQIVHRDLKPSNIMLTADGHVKVLDFGLAKRVDAAPEYAKTDSAITDTGTVQGTVAYMSPEQVRGESVDLRSDLFAVGVVMYECLTGRNPFLARSALETASEILHRAPPPPSTLRDEVPPSLDRLVRRLLAKPVDERYASAADLRVDLAAVRDGIERGDIEAATPQVTRSPFVMNRRAAIGSIAATLAAAAGGTWWWKAAVGRPRSLVVLPFIKGDDNAPDYLAAGIPIEVTRRLLNAGIDVKPWETGLQFRNKTATETAATLGVAFVLMGSLQTVKDRLLVNVSLVNGTDGSLSWSQSPEFGLPKLFDVQTLIAKGISDALGYQLTGEAAAMLERAESSSTDAWDLYLQGAWKLNDPDGGKSELDVALMWFEQALAVDPNLVAAHVGMGAARLESYWNGWGGGEGNLKLASASFEKARELDPKDMRAWRGLMLVEFYRGNGDRALQLGQQAARTGAPEIETLLARAEGYQNNGPAAMASPLLDRVLALDPFNEAAAWGRIIALHQSDGLEQELKQATIDYNKRFGDDDWVTVLRANGFVALGEIKEAAAVIDPLMDSLLPETVHADQVTAYQLVGLLGGGVIATNTGRRARGQQLWRRGMALTREGLDSDPESVTLKMFNLAFRGYANDPTFEVDAARIVSDVTAAGLNPFPLMYVGTGYAYRGDIPKALDILRYNIKRGRLSGRLWLTVWTPGLKDAPEFRQLLAEYEDEENRRRREYGGAS